MDNMSDNVLMVETLLSRIGNLKAPQNDLIFGMLQKLAGEGDLEIEKKGGGRKKASTSIEVSVTLVRPSQRQLFTKYGEDRA